MPPKDASTTPRIKSKRRAPTPRTTTFKRKVEEAIRTDSSTPFQELAQSYLARYKSTPVANKAFIEKFKKMYPKLMEKFKEEEEKSEDSEMGGGMVSPPDGVPRLENLERDVQQAIRTGSDSWASLSQKYMQGDEHFKTLKKKHLEMLKEHKPALIAELNRAHDLRVKSIKKENVIAGVDDNGIVTRLRAEKQRGPSLEQTPTPNEKGDNSGGSSARAIRQLFADLQSPSDVVQDLSQNVVQDLSQKLFEAKGDKPVDINESPPFISPVPLPDTVERTWYDSIKQGAMQTGFPFAAKAAQFYNDYLNEPQDEDSESDVDLDKTVEEIENKFRTQGENKFTGDENKHTGGESKYTGGGFNRPPPGVYSFPGADPSGAGNTNPFFVYGGNPMSGQRDGIKPKTYTMSGAETEVEKNAVTGEGDQFLNNPNKPKSGAPTLRPRFGIAAPKDVIPPTTEQLRSDLEFDLFSVVPPGYGEGVSNKLFLYQRAWDDYLRFAPPFFGPGPWLGPLNTVYPMPWQWQTIKSGKDIKGHYDKEMSKLSAAKSVVRSHGEGSAAAFGRDVPEHPVSISSSGLPRDSRSPFEPVIHNTQSWTPDRDPAGYLLGKRGLKRTFSAWRDPDAFEHQRDNGGPTLRKRRSLEVILP